MNNNERYRRAFSTVHASRDYSKEVFEMKNTNRKVHFTRAMAACLAVCLLLGTAGVCYANNVGGIQRQIQLWINGDQTAATIEFDGEGRYSLSYKDSNGDVYAETGGGIKFDKNGNEIPVTDEELLKEIYAPNVEYADDKATLYYYNKVEDNYYENTLDITDLFVEDVCYITLTQDDKPLYITVKYQNGLATSPNRYLSPNEFN